VRANHKATNGLLQEEVVCPVAEFDIKCLRDSWLYAILLQKYTKLLVLKDFVAKPHPITKIIIDEA
jgi:hypothetical protein